MASDAPCYQGNAPMIPNILPSEARRTPWFKHHGHLPAHPHVFHGHHSSLWCCWCAFSSALQSPWPRCGCQGSQNPGMPPDLCCCFWSYLPAGDFYSHSRVINMLLLSTKVLHFILLLREASLLHLPLRMSVVCSLFFSWPRCVDRVSSLRERLTASLESQAPVIRTNSP